MMWVVAAALAAGAAAWMCLRPTTKRHWCCMEDRGIGFGVCFRSEMECLPSKEYYYATQDRAACFDSRLVVRDYDLEDCSPTMGTCERSRTKHATDPEYDGVTACRAVGADEKVRRAQYPKVAAAIGGVGLLGAAVAWRRRRRARQPPAHS